MCLPSQLNVAVHCTSKRLTLCIMVGVSISKRVRHASDSLFEEYTRNGE